MVMNYFTANPFRDKILPLFIPQCASSSSFSLHTQGQPVPTHLLMFPGLTLTPLIMQLWAPLRKPLATPKSGNVRPALKKKGNIKINLSGDCHKNGAINFCITFLKSLPLKGKQSCQNFSSDLGCWYQTVMTSLLSVVHLVVDYTTAW